jgi:hypothetical protein
VRLGASPPVSASERTWIPGVGYGVPDEPPKRPQGASHIDTPLPISEPDSDADPVEIPDPARAGLSASEQWEASRRRMLAELDGLGRFGYGERESRWIHAMKRRIRDLPTPRP